MYFINEIHYLLFKVHITQAWGQDYLSQLQTSLFNQGKSQLVDLQGKSAHIFAYLSRLQGRTILRLQRMVILGESEQKSITLMDGIGGCDIFNVGIRSSILAIKVTVVKRVHSRGKSHVSMTIVLAQLHLHSLPDSTLALLLMSTHNSLYHSASLYCQSSGIGFTLRMSSPYHPSLYGAKFYVYFLAHNKNRLIFHPLQMLWKTCLHCLFHSVSGEYFPRCNILYVHA